MNGEIIKQFLVGLGFEIDDSSLSKFNKSIASAATRVTALYTSVNAAAAGIVYGISKISEGFEQMGYEYRIIAPMINKQLMLRNAMLSAYRAAGINITKVVQASVKLNFSLAKTKFALDAIYKSVGSRFFALITKQSDVFRDKLYKNMPKIQATLEKFVKFIFKSLEAITYLGLRLWSILTRVYDFFVKLDRATDGWSTIILGVIAAWKLLNLSFLATPFGMLIAGLVGLLALYDDFKTWQEGGKSLFDWTKVAPYVEAALKILSSILEVTIAIGGALSNIFHGDWGGLVKNLGRVADAFVNISNAVDSIVRHLGGGFINKVLDWRDKFDAAGLSAIGINPQGIVAPPLGTNQVQNSQTNMHVNQQTQINVSGSADANAVGKHVAGEQNRVNFDFTRNLKGAVSP